MNPAERTRRWERAKRRRAAARLCFDQGYYAESLTLQKELPDAQIVPCETIEGEALHLEVRLPTASEEERKQAQERALDLKRRVEDRYGLSILVRVV